MCHLCRRPLSRPELWNCAKLTIKLQYADTMNRLIKAVNQYTSNA